MKLGVRYQENDKFRFPQELEDIIILMLDMCTLVECRTLQSNYVKKCTEYDSLETAVKKGNLHCVRYLLSQEYGCITWAMNLAAYYGHLEIVKWLHYNRTEGCTTFAMDWAAANGRLEIIEFLKNI